MWRRFVGIFAIAAGCGGPHRTAAPSPAIATGFLVRTVTLPDGRSRKFSVFIPRDYAPGKAWPTVVFLQGIGEGGADGKKQTTVGLGPYVRAHADTFELIAIFPQSGGLWSSDDADAIAMGCLADVTRAYRVDARRVYLTGISTGGFGTWKIGAAHADVFAAIAPMCARSGEDYAATLAAVPVWAFHNALDPFVWSNATRDTVKAINAQGGHARSTIYSAVGHDCWTRTYKEAAFWQWLLAQHKA